MKATLGTENGLEFIYDLEHLKKHFIALGSSGSGKTVLCKAIIEEAMMKGLPAILVDPQGDIASLIIDESNGKVADQKLKQMRETRITIFSPTSSKGIPLSIAVPWTIISPSVFLI